MKKETLAEEAKNPRGVDTVRFAADGKHYYGGGLTSGGLFFYNVSDGSSAGILTYEHFACGALTGDLRLLAWGTKVDPAPGAKNFVVVTAPAAKKELMRAEVPAPVGVVAFSGDGSALAAAMVDGRVLLWRSNK
jgi:hypothetical protein